MLRDRSEIPLALTAWLLAQPRALCGKRSHPSGGFCLVCPAEKKEIKISDTGARIHRIGFNVLRDLVTHKIAMMS